MRVKVLHLSDGWNIPSMEVINHAVANYTVNKWKESYCSYLKRYLIGNLSKFFEWFQRMKKILKNIYVCMIHDSCLFSFHFSFFPTFHNIFQKVEEVSNECQKRLKFITFEVSQNHQKISATCYQIIVKAYFIMHHRMSSITLCNCILNNNFLSTIDFG